MHRQTIVTQSESCPPQILFGNHDTTRENPDRALKSAHIYVQFKAVYILPLEKRFGEGDLCWVSGLHKQFHSHEIRTLRRKCRALLTGV